MMRELSVTDIRPGTRLDVATATKADLVAIHEEQRRLKRLVDAAVRSAKMLSNVRLAVELRLSLEHHEWDFADDYDPDDPVYDEKRAEREQNKNNPEELVRRMFGG